MKVVEWVFVGSGLQVNEWITMKRTEIRKGLEPDKKWASKIEKKQHKWDQKLFLTNIVSAEGIAWFVMTEKLKKFVRKRNIQKRLTKGFKQVLNGRGVKNIMGMLAVESKEKKIEEQK